MKARYLLGIALAAATAVAACGGGSTNTLSNGLGGAEETGGEGTGSGKKGGVTGDTDGDGTTDVVTEGGETVPGTTPGAPVPTNSPAGKEFYKANVHGFMASACGACHNGAGINGAPGWLTSADAEKSYAQLFQVGYVIRQSRIIVKPAHGGVPNNVLSTAQIQTYNTWVEMELKDGGGKAPPNVMEKLGSCFDRAKFDAMNMGAWQTQTRGNGNNVNNVTPWNENADNCTGCKPAACRACHLADPATNYNNTIGFPGLPENTTFENTKLASPAYITKFFGVSAEGKPIPSDGLKKKSDATKKEKAYGHPLYNLNQNKLAAIDAFVQDVITKYNAGTCGK